MIKQVLLPILGVIVFIIAVGLFVQKTGSINFSATQATPTPKPSVVTIGNQSIQVTLAKTREERTKGLSGTATLEVNSGMLFVFDSKANPVFWMKDMLIPLDIIWINNGKIVKIDKNVPIAKPGTPDSKLTTYSNSLPVDYVLEVNAGFADINNIKVGDQVDLTAI